MRVFPLFAMLAAAMTAPLAAQGILPALPLPRLGGVLDPLRATVDDTARTATELARDRVRMLDRLVRRNSEAIELDASGEPARRGELLVMDAPDSALERVRGAGFAIGGTERIAELGLSVTRVRTPAGVSLAEAEALLARLAPGVTVSADHLHFQSGAASSSDGQSAAGGARSASSAAVGVIDGAPGKAVPVTEIRGFAQGAPLASDHGSAVASLALSAGAGPVRVADVYGADKAGGNALAIARALGWLVGEGSRVVTISLVGPRNAVLERAIRAAQAKHVLVIAAVGNDGPAAPPAFPASYPGVVAVTAVDGKRRALIEAGRALNLDYAAPGADISAPNARGKRVKLRGTSFAAPLVAGRAARAIAATGNWRGTLDREAIDLGKKGADQTYGRGLVCAACRGR